VTQGVVIAVLVLVLALVLVGLLLATRMMRLIGVTGANVITRVLGVILGALAVQYVVDGVAGSFGGL
jgi:multiple antibiotic resistance protein